MSKCPPIVRMTKPVTKHPETREEEVTKLLAKFSWQPVDPLKHKPKGN